MHFELLTEDPSTELLVVFIILIYNYYVNTIKLLFDFFLI
nr:MAG TPA: hypothetical protein [Caudoviricetes sp.]